MFGISDFGAFAMAFVLLLFLPGPGNLALISSASKGGLAGGLASVLGLLVGDQILLWLTVAGMAAILQSFPTLFLIIQWAGAAYLAWLGFKMLTAKAGEGHHIEITPGHYFRETMTITLLNPKAILFYLAFFPQFIDPVHHQGWITFAVMALTIAALGFMYCLGVVLVTHFMAERLRAKPVVSGLLQKLAGVCLIGFSLKLALME
ncbi:lysine transporter LysE [Limnohabitans sp. T6-5]|uniref:LysE family transporter n=1 Tax=Limnohabitans sp. T6-5 TaxID=1100724 RepID=UPI000D338070|nr:LysE family transporter [Limnohabitans sp. T6-5]PUE06684.1 lysine transporter LysE [Limnohabitans sp. T6-5]